MFVSIFVLFLMAYSAWPGSKSIFVIFSFSFSALLYFAIKSYLSAGYLFLASALWIGYWLKLSLHIIQPALPWMEPIGYFDFSNSAWDEVAIIATIGAFGVLVGGFLCYSLCGLFNSNYITYERTSRFRIVCWIVGLSAVFSIIVLNEKFSIVHQSIPPSELGLPFHLQGFFNWLMGGGGLLLLMIPLYLEVISGNFLCGTGLVLLASVFIGVSLWSRGTVVFQSLIFIISLYVYKAYLPKFNMDQLLNLFGLMVSAIVLSVGLSEVRREVFFASVKPVSAQPVSAQPVLSSYSLFLILKLPVERWIGLEGVMAMSAYPSKSTGLLLHAIDEKRLIGKIDMYTHTVALSPSIDTKTVMYATPPSLFAFWYYSGSLFVVFIGSVVLTLLVLAAERLIFFTSHNPFLSAAVGVGGAIQLVHLGTGGLFMPAVIFAMSLSFALLIGYWSKYSYHKESN